MKTFLKLLFVILVFIFTPSFVIGLIYLLIYLSKIGNLDLTWFWIIISYIFFSAIVFGLRIFIDKKLVRVIADIIVFPIYLLFNIIFYIFPFLKLTNHYVITFGISFLIPYSILIILSNYTILNISEELKVYIILTTIVFLSVLLNSFFQRITNMLLLIFGKPKKLEEKFIQHVATQNNLKFVIYAGYVFLVIALNICKLQDTTLFANQNYDTAVAQSFVTFLAFDKALGLGQQMKFSGWKTILAYIDDVKSFTNQKKD